MAGGLADMVPLPGVGPVFKAAMALTNLLLPSEKEIAEEHHKEAVAALDKQLSADDVQNDMIKNMLDSGVPPEIAHQIDAVMDASRGRKGWEPDQDEWWMNPS